MKVTPSSPQKSRIYAYAGGFFALGLAAGLSAFFFGSPAKTPRIIHENVGGYQFINPILFTADGRKADYPQYKPLEDKISALISQETSARKASDVSVYFRDLTNDSWTGVNETHKYAPASMLKVAVMMGYLKVAETDPSIMTEKAYYRAEDVPGQFYKPEQYLPTGMHTNEELIESMIKQSDNTAETILTDNMLQTSRRQVFDQIFSDLHMPLPSSTSTSDFLSPQQYSRIFRALYDGAYLPNSFSEYALELLSHTDFPQGIASGVPDSTTVSHKFGERSVVESDGTVSSRELHDCGIIYRPNKPYFLCVMTRGTDFPSLQSVISDVSALVSKSL